jgi:hypothetical protein
MQAQIRVNVISHACYYQLNFRYPHQRESMAIGWYSAVLKVVGVIV